VNERCVVFVGMEIVQSQAAVRYIARRSNIGKI
jgi:hypothetical protein